MQRGTKQRAQSCRVSKGRECRRAERGRRRVPAGRGHLVKALRRGGAMRGGGVVGDRL